MFVFVLLFFNAAAIDPEAALRFPAVVHGGTGQFPTQLVAVNQGQAAVHGEMGQFAPQRPAFPQGQAAVHGATGQFLANLPVAPQGQAVLLGGTRQFASNLPVAPQGQAVLLGGTRQFASHLQATPQGQVVLVQGGQFLGGQVAQWPAFTQGQVVLLRGEQFPGHTANVAAQHQDQVFVQGGQVLAHPTQVPAQQLDRSKHPSSDSVPTPINPLPQPSSNIPDHEDDTKVPTSSWRKAQITAWISSRTEFPENFPPSDRLGDYTVVELLDLGSLKKDTLPKGVLTKIKG